MLGLIESIKQAALDELITKDSYMDNKPRALDVFTARVTISYLHTTYNSFFLVLVSRWTTDVDRKCSIDNLG
jgi:hypothetical protein